MVTEKNERSVSTMTYVIINHEESKIEGFFKNEDEARQSLYELRKKKYMRDHPTSPVNEYDRLRCDYGINLYESTFKLIG